MTHPFAWVKKVSETICSLDAIPLFGNAPPFDWEHFSSLLATKFGAEHFHVQPKGQRWTTKEELAAGLGPDVLVLSLTLSPLAPPLFWAMGKSDRDTLTSFLLTRHGQERAFSSDLLQEGFYRFLWLEALDAAQSLEPIQSMPLHLGDEAPLPQEEAFCIDVELIFKGGSGVPGEGRDEASSNAQNITCWGRLIVTAEFQTAWSHHFSAFPHESIRSQVAAKTEVVIGVKTGSILMDQTEMDALQPGDFLLLDAGSYDARKGQGLATLMLEQTPLFQVKIKQNKIEILDYAFIYEDTMKEPPTAPHAPASQKLEAAEETNLAIQELPIYVTVELSRVKMTLDKLMQLTPGNLLELPIHPEQGVSLTVNGQKVGKAELVYLGEALGVRILELGR